VALILPKEAKFFESHASASARTRTCPGHYATSGQLARTSGPSKWPSGGH